MNSVKAFNSKTSLRDNCSADATAACFASRSAWADGLERWKPGMDLTTCKLGHVLAGQMGEHVPTLSFS